MSLRSATIVQALSRMGRPTRSIAASTTRSISHAPRPLAAATTTSSCSYSSSAREFRYHRTYSTTTTTPAEAEAAEGAAKVAPVLHRGVVEVKGRDTVKLIQGLVSNDVRRLEKGEVNALFASFLNPQGRMLADVFIHRLPSTAEGERWLLDVDKRTMPTLLSFIKRFKLRSKVTLRDVSDEWKVYQLWGGDGTVAANVLGSSEEKVVVPDGRAPGMGFRAITRDPDGLVAASGASVEEATRYALHRIVHGVAEGAMDFPEGASVPLETNVDYMHGVDFRKGCYVGQELTARTHHTGVVRKRIVPLSFYHPNSPVPSTLAPDFSFSTALPAPHTEVRSTPLPSASTGTDAAPSPRGRSAGKVTTTLYNLGLGCLRLEQVARSNNPQAEDALQLSVKNEKGETLLVKAWIPDWWPEQEGGR
ncbi:ccr4 associated factor [Thecaphora frezii]